MRDNPYNPPKTNAAEPQCEDAGLRKRHLWIWRKRQVGWSFWFGVFIATLLALVLLTVT